MATAFQALDNPSSFMPTHKPRIRVVFSATRAMLAVRSKAAATPEASSTLEELTTTPPLRVLLADRNAIIERVNTGPDLSEEEQGPTYEEISRLEALISNTPARTAEDAIAKLVAAAQVAAEGHELDDAEAVRAIADAQRHLGVGYIHRELQHYAADPVTNTLPDATEWQRAFDAYLLARGARQVHERLVLDPAAAHFDAVRSRWPSNYEVAKDAAASAALAEVEYEDVQDRFDELVDVEHRALENLLFCPAPTAEDLTTKLRLFGSEEMWTIERPGKLAETFAADACRFARPSTDVGSDATLLAAFADRCDEAAYWASPSRPASTEEIEERSNAVVAEAEKVIFGTEARTIGGVVAKLRTLYPSLSQQVYAEAALDAPSGDTFKQGLQRDSGNYQVLWGCIEDLARIGGIDLAGQGA